MASNYWSIDRKSVMKHRKEYEAELDINTEMLLDGTIKKYGVGINGDGKNYLTTATIVDPITGGTVKVNAKNALFIGLEALAYKFNLQENSFIYNPDGRMRKLMAALMAESDLGNFNSKFYKHLLTKANRRDEIRNCRSGIPYQACFTYIKTNRYTPVKNNLIETYSEREIAEIADVLYFEIAEPYVKSKKMTPVIREVISETVDIKLQSEYGWKFSHQQYSEMELNEELIERIVSAFPGNRATMSLLEMILKYDASQESSTMAKIIMKHPKANPLTGNKTWKEMMERELRHPFNVISENFLEDILKLKTPHDKQSFIRRTVTEFVYNTNTERLTQTSFIRGDANDRDTHINTEKDVNEVCTFLNLALERIECPEENSFDPEFLKTLMILDMAQSESEVVRKRAEKLLADSGILEELDKKDLEVLNFRNSLPCKHDIYGMYGKYGDEYDLEWDESKIDRGKQYDKDVKHLLNRIASLQTSGIYDEEGYKIMMDRYMPNPVDPWFGHGSREEMIKRAFT